MLTKCAICNGTGKEYRNGEYTGPTCWLCQGSGQFDWDRWHDENAKQCTPALSKLRAIAMLPAVDFDDYVRRCRAVGIWPGTNRAARALRVRMKKRGAVLKKWRTAFYRPKPGKYCHGCNRRLPRREFHKDNGAPDGLQSRCKQCRRGYRTKEDV